MAAGVEHEAASMGGSRCEARGEAEHEATYIDVLRVSYYYLLKTGGQQRDV
jgi:hypothetical protein